MISWHFHQGKIHEGYAHFFNMTPEQDRADRGSGIKLIGRWHDLAAAGLPLTGGVGERTPFPNPAVTGRDSPADLLAKRVLPVAEPRRGPVASVMRARTGWCHVYRSSPGSATGSCPARITAAGELKSPLRAKPSRKALPPGHCGVLSAIQVSFNSAGNGSPCGPPGGAGEAMPSRARAPALEALLQLRHVSSVPPVG